MSISLENVSKRYEQHAVVNHVSLQVEEGELFVLLGSSGSGKTTILSLIAGLIPLDEGKIFINGRDVSWLSPQERQVGFVFQNYALFQNMTVAENVEFGLSVRKTPKPQRRQRREELLELVGLAGLGKRMPRQLSGGQQQRVALARALAHQPEVLLLDEPLGALDAKIRVELRRTLRSIQQQLKITTIMVTHDQEEAFDLADRIGVMSFGRLLEIGSPKDLYQYPKTEFVASFLGQANLLLGRAAAGAVQLGQQRFPFPQFQAAAEEDGKRVQVLFRPEDVDLAAELTNLSSPPLGMATVDETSFGGPAERLRLYLPSIPGVRPLSPSAPFGSKSIVVEASRSPEQAVRYPLQRGDKVWVGLHRIHTITHPGLNVLIVTDGSLRSQAALAFGSELVRLAHARVTLLGCETQGQALEKHLEDARRQMAGGVASIQVQTSKAPFMQAIGKTLEFQPYDLVILGFEAAEHLHLVEQILLAGEHHLLLVPAPQAIPDRALVCVASGEPGKSDILFAGRLMSHFGAEATLLSVILEQHIGDLAWQERVQRFLEQGVQSLALLNVPAQVAIRWGNIHEEIAKEMKAEEFGLLVLGAPLANPRGEISLSGPALQILLETKERAILIVRSPYSSVRVFKVPPAYLA